MKTPEVRLPEKNTPHISVQAQAQLYCEQFQDPKKANKPPASIGYRSRFLYVLCTVCRCIPVKASATLCNTKTHDATQKSIKFVSKMAMPWVNVAPAANQHPGHKHCFRPNLTIKSDAGNVVNIEVTNCNDRPSVAAMVVVITNYPQVPY